MRRKLALWGILAVGAVLTASVTAYSTGNDDQPSMVIGTASSDFPAESLEDWVTYANQVSVIAVTGERELPRDPEVVKNGEGYIERAIRLTILDTIWRRSPSDVIDGEIEIVAWGWALKDGVKHPFGVDDGPRLEVGSKYLMPLINLGGKEWAAPNDASIFPVEPSNRLGRTRSALNSSAGGKPIAEVKTILAETRPDPRAEKYGTLPPRERARAVQQEKALVKQRPQGSP